MNDIQPIFMARTGKALRSSDNSAEVLGVKLISEWRKAHKFSSMQLMAVAAGVEAISAALGGVVSPWVIVGLIIFAMVARVVAQDGVK